MSFIERLVAATIGFNGYARLGRFQASGFGFMAFILAVVMTISCVYTTVTFNREWGREVGNLDEVPDFAVRNGQVDFKAPMPYIVEEGNSIIIIDTTGKTQPEDLERYQTGILITRDTVYQVNMGQIQTIDLSQVPINVNKSDVVRFIRGLWIFIPIGYVFMYLFQLGFKALDAVILGLVGLIYGSATGRKVEFGLAFKLGLYAVTVPMALQWLIPNLTTIPFSNFPIGLSGFAGFWAIAIIYLIFGLQAYFKAQDEEQQGYYAGNS